MASNQNRSPTDNKASIALLRHLRAGGDDVHFVVHRVDVCAAPPEVLVADLEPVPGTGVEDDGYSRIWYFYHAKKYKNTRGDTSGHRQHSEIGRKDVQGSGGGTFCNFSYGRKTDPSSRSMDRMGWCMVEYDFVAADKKQDEAAADSSNYVLCKVYRSPRAKGKSASASASSSSKKSSSKQMAKKRKAGGGEHPEAPPAKSIQQQEQVQQETAYYPMANYRYQRKQTCRSLPCSSQQAQAATSTSTSKKSTCTSTTSACRELMNRSRDDDGDCSSQSRSPSRSTTSSSSGYL